MLKSLDSAAIPLFSFLNGRVGIIAACNHFLFSKHDCSPKMCNTGFNLRFIAHRKPEPCNKVMDAAHELSFKYTRFSDATRKPSCNNACFSDETHKSSCSTCKTHEVPIAAAQKARLQPTRCSDAAHKSGCSTRVFRMKCTSQVASLETHEFSFGCSSTQKLSSNAHGFRMKHTSQATTHKF